MPKTNRLREGLILVACAPAMAAIAGVLIVGDRAGLWGAR